MSASIKSIPYSEYSEWGIFIKDEEAEDDLPKIFGWICPVCGRGLSPWTSACPCKGGKGWEVTC